MLLDVSTVVSLRGLVTRRQHKGSFQGPVMFLGLMLVTYVCSNCENSLSCKLIISVFFACIIMFLKSTLLFYIIDNYLYLFIYYTVVLPKCY